MKYFDLLLLSIVLVICSPEVKSSDEIESFIVNGQTVFQGEFPSAVYIDIPDRRPHCGGTIVNSQHVVSAAQCFIRFTFGRGAGLEIVHSNLLRIIAGDINYMVPNFGRVIRSVSNIFVHPSFNYYSHENDIAVLRISEPFQFPDNFIESAVRQRRIVPVGHVCVFAGWSMNAQEQPINIDLQQINVQIVQHETCNAPPLYAGRVLESMMCGGSILGQLPQSVCSGNEGGALYCNNKLTGILSFGQTCGNPIQSAVYTQIRFYNDWLDEQFARNDSPQHPIW